MALELIKRLKPDYVAVAWDKPKTNIRKRKEMYPEYKAGRKPPPPDFYAQIPLLHELLEAFGWPLYELDDYEADDIMGAFSVQAAKKGIENYANYIRSRCFAANSTASACLCTKKPV